MFSQIGGWCVACNGKILVLLHFVWKLVINKTHKHNNQKTVSHIFLSANDIYSFLQKIRVYDILLIPPKFAKFLEMCYRGKLQCLQGTTSYEGTTKLRKLTINWGHDWLFYFHKLEWSGNKWKYLGAWYVGSFIPPSRKRDILTETRYYGHFYVIFMFELHEKKSSQQGWIPLTWRRDPV